MEKKELGDISRCNSTSVCCETPLLLNGRGKSALQEMSHHWHTEQMISVGLSQAQARKPDGLFWNDGMLNCFVVILLHFPLK